MSFIKHWDLWKIYRCDVEGRITLSYPYLSLLSFKYSNKNISESFLFNREEVIKKILPNGFWIKLLTWKYYESLENLLDQTLPFYT